MANVSINLSQSALNYSVISPWVFTDNTFQSIGTLQNLYSNFTNYKFTGNQLITSFSDGSSTVYTGTVSNPYATSGTATSSSVVFNIPNSLSVIQTGSINYQWYSYLNYLYFHSINSEIRQFSFQTLFPTNSSIYNQRLQGNELDKISGDVLFDSNNNISGYINQLYVQADKIIQSLTINGNLNISGNFNNINNKVSNSQLSGNLSSYSLNLYDGSYINFDTAGNSINLTNNQKISFYDFLSNPSNFNGNDNISVIMPSSIPYSLLISSGNGDDNITIGGGGNLFNVNAGNGNDTIKLMDSGHSIDGSSGYNTVIYNLSNSKNYKISNNSSGLNVYSTSQGLTDSLANIQKISFNDITLDTTSFTKTASLSHTNIVNLVELYIASFNRAPDSVGLDYWGGRLSDGMSLQDIAKSFFVQPETVAAYPSNMPTSDFVTKVYNNVLSRGPDSGGLNYWVGELNNGHVTKDSFLLAIINGAMAPTGSAVDRQTLANKEAVGEHYAIYQGLNNSTNWAKDVMSGVTDQMATVTAANAKADGYAAIAANPATSDLVVKLVGVAV